MTSTVIPVVMTSCALPQLPLRNPCALPTRLSASEATNSLYCSRQLIRIADERLYRLKHANHHGSARTETPSAPEQPVTPASDLAAPAPQPISIETRRTPEKTETTIAAAASATSAAISGDLTPASSRTFTIQRKAERVSMTGTNAYAVLGDQGARRARVLD